MSKNRFERGDLVWHTFKSQEELAEALAQRVAQRLSQACAVRSKASIAFSGGSTPKPFFKALQQLSLPWQNIVATLVDERWVANTHALSNEQFIQQNLFSKLADQPTFVPLFHDALDSPEHAYEAIEAAFSLAFARASLDKRFDSVILGMGTDGHTASFFPDAPNINELIQYDPSELLQSCHSTASQVQRITWSLAALLDTRDLILHITGQAKRDLFEQATQAPLATMADLAEYPIRTMAYQRHIPLHIYYAD